jgi:hypothetical protein
MQVSRSSLKQTFFMKMATVDTRETNAEELVLFAANAQVLKSHAAPLQFLFLICLRSCCSYQII